MPEPRVRRAVARWLIRIARRLHPIRGLTDLRVVSRMDSALNPEKPRPIDHRTHVHVSEPAFSYHNPTDRTTTLARRRLLRCGRCGQTYRKPAVGSWCCNSPRPHIPTS